MAVLTGRDWVPSGYTTLGPLGSGQMSHLFGEPIPDNIVRVDHWYDVMEHGVWIGWITKTGLKDKFLLRNPVEREQVVALIVMMRMSG